jgi:hypothetical protein
VRVILVNYKKKNVAVMSVGIFYFLLVFGHSKMFQNPLLPQYYQESGFVHFCFYSSCQSFTTETLLPHRVPQ